MFGQVVRKLGNDFFGSKIYFLNCFIIKTPNKHIYDANKLMYQLKILLNLS